MNRYQSYQAVPSVFGTHYRCESTHYLPFKCVKCVNTRNSPLGTRTNPYIGVRVNTDLGPNRTWYRSSQKTTTNSGAST